MQPELAIASSAYNNGIDSGDMVHAFNNALAAFDLDDGFIMLIGPAMDATMLEIGYVTSTDSHVIIHPMEARPKFLR